jgi:hypothetical protein
MRYCASSERVCNVLKAALALVLLFGSVIANRAEAQNNLTNPTNGRVLVNPIRAFVIYWLPPGVALDTTVVGNIGNFESLTQKFFSDISGTNYFNIVTQYPGSCGTCVVENFASNPVTLGGAFVDTQPYPHPGALMNAGTRANPLLDSDIQTELRTAISQNKWIVDVNSVFFVITGVFNSGTLAGSPVEECRGINCTFRGMAPFCGYHNAFSLNPLQTVIYSYMSDASFATGGCNMGITTSPNGQIASDREVALMTHEFFESVTDPDLKSWFDPTTGNEIGDNCNQRPSAVNLNGNIYVVQQQWSNTSSSCVASFPPSDGTLLHEPNGAIWAIFGGAKFHVPDVATLNRLYNNKTIKEATGGVNGLPTVPVDGTLLREENGTIWVIFGGARFHVPDPATLDRLFGGKSSFQLWDGAPAGIPTVPVDGTLLREENNSQTFIVQGGHKVAAPPSAVGTVYVLWDGALSQIP